MALKLGGMLDTLDLRLRQACLPVRQAPGRPAGLTIGCSISKPLVCWLSVRLSSRRSLGGGHADGTWEARLHRYLKPDLLIIDDFATKEFTLQQAEDIYGFIDEHSRSGSPCYPDWLTGLSCALTG